MLSVTGALTPGMWEKVQQAIPLSCLPPALLSKDTTQKQKRNRKEKIDTCLCHLCY